MTRRRWIPILAPFAVVGGLLFAWRLLKPVPVHELPVDWQHPDLYEEPQAAFMDPPELISIGHKGGKMSRGAIPLPLARDRRSHPSSRRGRRPAY